MMVDATIVSTLQALRMALTLLFNLKKVSIIISLMELEGGIICRRMALLDVTPAGI